MKKILSFLIFTLAAANLFGAVKKVQETSTPASDSRITYVGRHLANEEGVSFDWSGVYAKIRFEGNYIAIKASDTQKNYYNVWIDKDASSAPDKIISIFGKDSLITLFDEAYFKSVKNTKGTDVHRLIIQKRTEGHQGRTTIHSFITKGRILEAEGPKERIIEFIGDSYTCGYGTENSIRTDPFKAETENSNLSYAPIVARYFDADYILIAHSGMGISRNYNEGEKGHYMPDKYLQTFDIDETVKWDAKSSNLKPQITVIYLGTNDFSTNRQPTLRNFKENYIRLLKSIKENYGKDHPILCVGSKMDEMLYDYLRDIVRICGLSQVSYMVLSERIHNIDSELGASWHPNYKGHIKKAYAMIPYISTMTGWDMSEKPVK